MRDDDYDDVTARPHNYGTPRWQYTDDEPTRIRTLLHKRRDQILDRLNDPTLTPEQRQHYERLHTEINTDLRASRYGADWKLIYKLGDKWR
jgi:hypothetical protein